jgi:hypothetical protein
MPSVSRKQHRFMEAVAHSPEFAAQAGVPQKVGEDFAKADDAAHITKTHHGKPIPGRKKRLPLRVGASVKNMRGGLA